jgi:hypothetical protein
VRADDTPILQKPVVKPAARSLAMPPPVAESSPEETRGGPGRFNPPNENLVQGWATGRDRVPAADPVNRAEQSGIPENSRIHRAQVEALVGIPSDLEATSGMRSSRDVTLALQRHEKYFHNIHAYSGTGSGAI